MTRKLTGRKLTTLIDATAGHTTRYAGRTYTTVYARRWNLSYWLNAKGLIEIETRHYGSHKCHVYTFES